MDGEVQPSKCVPNMSRSITGIDIKLIFLDLLDYKSSIINIRFTDFNCILDEG